MNYKGVIIEESLKNKNILKEVAILSTSVEKVVGKHKTPWLKQWTLHTVEIPKNQSNKIAKNLSKFIDSEHGGSWYADFKNDEFHYIIFRNKIFKVDRSQPEEYKKAVEYGLSLGIPDYQLDLSPNIN